MTPKKVIQALQKDGFYLHHATGSHRFFKHPVKPGLITVPYHNKDLKRKTLVSIIKQAGLTNDEFNNLL
ncbi:type II toxin-antitoxin system HicA family toxin [bacterium]|nr:type II toxin-antitoxin system HicA family toxin [bacterium]